MWRNISLFILFSIPTALFAAVGNIIATSPDRPEAPEPLSVVLLARGENPDDPGHRLYKSGYNAILNEHWSEACDSFTELISAYPESRYLDDAYYWTAYAKARLKDQSQAIAFYNELIDRYPNSQYLDDAVADLSEIQIQLEIEELKEGLESARWSDESSMDRERELARLYSRIHWHQREFAPEAPDPETRLRIEALHALDPSLEEEETRMLVADVAKDPENPVALRVNAIHLLGNSPDNAIPVLVTIAKNDTGEVRSIALAYIAEGPPNQSVSAMIEVFESISPDGGPTMAQLFYTIAEVGNDDAVDFLASVATEDNDVNLRRDAIYYLGAIGTDKARSALKVILKGK